MYSAIVLGALVTFWNVSLPLKKSAILVTTVTIQLHAHSIRINISQLKTLNKAYSKPMPIIIRIARIIFFTLQPRPKNSIKHSPYSLTKRSAIS